MIALALVAGLVLLLWAQTALRIEETNEEVRAELGADYNEDAAGQPAQDGCLLIILVLLAAGFVFGILANVAPLLPR
jgi:hypothetical protein